MTNLTRYNAANINQLLDRITKNSIGMDEYFDRLFAQQQQSNYPPYNLVQLSDVESRLELALLDLNRRKYMSTPKMENFSSKEPGTASEDEESTFIHRGLNQRSFTRSWKFSDETEVGSVTFENGLDRDSTQDRTRGTSKEGLSLNRLTIVVATEGRLAQSS